MKEDETRLGDLGEHQSAARGRALVPHANARPFAAERGAACMAG